MEGLVEALSGFIQLAIGGSGGWVAVTGLMEYLKANGSQDAAAKNQAGGQIFGGVCIIFAAVALVPKIFEIF